MEKENYKTYGESFHCHERYKRIIAKTADNWNLTMKWMSQHSETNSGSFKTNRRHLLLDQRILYHNSIVKQTTMYVSIACISTSFDNFNMFFDLQKRAASMILNSDTRVKSVRLLRTKVSIIKAKYLWVWMTPTVSVYENQHEISSARPYTSKLTVEWTFKILFSYSY